MSRFDPGEDGFVLAAFLILLAMLVSGLTGAHVVFAYAVVAIFAVFIARGLVRARAPATWAVAAVATIVLVVSMAGILRNESAIVRSVDDTVLGFHPGTAYLVYGVWIPAFFTLAVGFALVFRFIEPGTSDRKPGQDVRR